jgi:hypothetical protein
MFSETLLHSLDDLRDDLNRHCFSGYKSTHKIRALISLVISYQFSFSNNIKNDQTYKSFVDDNCILSLDCADSSRIRNHGSRR